MGTFFKVISISLSLLVMAASCSKNIDDENAKLQGKNAGYLQMEQAFPHSEKKLITLPNGMQVAKFDSLYILGGDIVINQRELDSLCNYGTKAATTSIFSRYWFGGNVYYTLSSGLPVDERTKVINAMSYVHNATGIEFVPRTNQSNYIQFSQTNDGCFSDYIGMKGGQQHIGFSSEYNMMNVVHEICHALGFYHEQCRQDRDNYITVYIDSIPNSELPQYTKYSINTGFDFGGFDFNSIMLYSSMITVNGTLRIVMTKKDGTLFFPQRSYLSNCDIEAIKYIYGPPYVKLVKTTLTENSSADGGLDEYHATYSNCLYFYADKNCTIPITTSSSRLVVLSYVDIRQENGQISNTSYDEVLVVPAGTSTYFIGETSCDYLDEYGYTRYNYSTNVYMSGVGL